VGRRYRCDDLLLLHRLSCRLVRRHSRKECVVSPARSTRLELACSYRERSRCCVACMRRVETRPRWRHPRPRWPVALSAVVDSAVVWIGRGVGWNPGEHKHRVGLLRADRPRRTVGGGALMTEHHNWKYETPYFRFGVLTGVAMAAATAVALAYGLASALYYS